MTPKDPPPQKEKKKTQSRLIVVDGLANIIS